MLKSEDSQKTDSGNPASWVALMYPRNNQETTNKQLEIKLYSLIRF